MTLEQARAQVVRRVNLLTISKDGLIKYLTDLNVPHKAPWGAYAREELIEKLNSYVFQKRFDV